MKFTAIAVVLAASAGALAQTAPDLPPCALACTIQAASDAGCALYVLASVGVSGWCGD